jgi:hypothetical protein
MALDLARAMHLTSEERRLQAEVAANGMPYPIACDYLQEMLKKAARKYDAEVAARAKRRADRRAWEHEMPQWSPEVIAELHAAWDEQEAAYNALPD